MSNSGSSADSCSNDSSLFMLNEMGDVAKLAEMEIQSGSIMTLD